MDANDVISVAVVVLVIVLASGTLLPHFRQNNGQLRERSPMRLHGRRRQGFGSNSKSGKYSDSVNHSGSESYSGSGSSDSSGGCDSGSSSCD